MLHWQGTFSNVGATTEPLDYGLLETAGAEDFYGRPLLSNNSIWLKWVAPSTAHYILRARGIR
jgi:hypothetical protein